jgi:hypothetical protein
MARNLQLRKSGLQNHAGNADNVNNNGNGNFFSEVVFQVIREMQSRFYMSKYSVAILFDVPFSSRKCILLILNSL